MSQATHLSCSQIQCLFRCPREWVYKYILKYSEKTSDALLVGRAFHSLIENKALTQADLEGLDLSYPWHTYFKTMYAGFKVTREKYPKTLTHEAVYHDENIKMYADELIRNESGDWWIGETKTAGKRDPNKARMLTQDLQINLYAAHKNQLAEKYWLDRDRFQGVLYFVTLKPMERRKKEENNTKFAERFTSETEVIEVDVDTLRPESALQTFDYGLKMREYFTKIYEAHRDHFQVPCNTGSCTRFGKPCPFFEECYGKA